MYKKDLIIFSNLRQIKEYLKSICKEGFFASTISINDFLNDFALSEGKRASQTQQIIAMNRACNKTRDYKKLNFSSDFLSFLKNKEYLFSFFSELNSQNVSIDALRNNDLYSFFDEYLDILEECLKHYKSELSAQGLYDEITLSKLTPNYFLLNQYKSISFYLNGFLKQYELDFFALISKHCELKIITNISRYNADLLSRSFACKLEPNHRYTLSYDEGWQISSKEPLTYNKKIKTAGFKSALEQYIYALHLISANYPRTNNIALIMPDENAASSLKALDIHNYLNIASGLNSSEIAQKLNALLEDNEYASIQKQLLQPKELDFSDFDALSADILNLSQNSEIKEILKNRLHEIKILKDEFSLSNDEVIKLLEPKSIKISHTDGGNVDALGLLESRGMQKDFVIIVDFNDDLVPKRSVNEMFLNSAVRAHAGLISYTDRENLQRHYYAELFNAKEVFVLYLENEEKSPARMLRDYECQHEIIDEKALLSSYLAAKNGTNTASDALLEPDIELIKKHDFFATPLSYSRLACYLNSPYEYYLKYILNLREPANKLASEGSSVHEFFENANMNNLKAEFTEYFKDSLSSIDYALIYNNLDEIAKFLKDFNAKTEAKISAKIDNIEAYGIIDRLSDELIIDYKNTHKPSSTKAHEKQLAFYSLLLGRLDITSALIYLKSSEGAVHLCKAQAKLQDEILQDLAYLKEGFILDKPENAYGYYHLIINKKDR